MTNKSAGIVVVLILVLIALGVIVFSFGALSIFIGSPDDDAPYVSIEIEPGENVTTIADKLKAEGLIGAERAFRFYGRVSGKARELQAGSFELRPGMNIKDLFEVLSRGYAAEREITMIEGWTTAELSEMLEARGIADAGEMSTLMFDSNLRSDYSFLSEVPTSIDLEGYLFPETYRFLQSDGAEEIIRTMLNQFEIVVVEGKADKLNSNNKSLFDIVTIASIVEREVQTLEDMALVSDLINRRLEIGMPLQMDSTVNYVTGKNDPSITFVDRDVDSPYNTYKYPGLPVGPISSPSEAAIDAVLNPTSNDYLFFLTTPEGEVIYARTNDEHVRNKVRYLK